MSDETTAIATTNNTHAVVPADPMAIFRLMDDIINSKFVDSLAKSGLYSERGDNLEVTRHKIVSKIAHGMELGLTPMASLSNVSVIKGKPCLGALIIGARIMRSRSVKYQVLESTDQVCCMKWFRDGVEQGINSWTIADAERANLLGKDNWRGYPVDMLRARCLTQGARTYCPDVFGGPIYTPEELGQSEIVQVTQHDRKDETRRQDAGAQVARDQALKDAQDRLVAACADCTADRDAQIRTWEACLKKANKNSKMMTGEDFDEATARVRAMHADGNLSEWCDTIHGPDDDVVGDAEVVDAAEDVEAAAWKSANGLFHAVLGKFLTANKFEPKGQEYVIIHDLVRSMGELPVDAPWSFTRSENMRKVVQLMEMLGGKAAVKGLDSKNGEWAVLAAARGAI